MRLLILAVLFGCLIGCAENHNESPSPEMAIAPEVIAADQANTIKEFENFLTAISLKPGTFSNEKLCGLASAFLADSTIHKDQYLYARPISYPDSFHLIFYEYSLDGPPESNIYLGTFDRWGDALDVLKLREVTYNGTVSVVVIDENIVEVEYYDYYRMDELYQGDALSDRTAHLKALPRQVNQQSADEEGSKLVEFYYYENYRINKRGHFVKLAAVDTVNTERRWPHTSLRVLSSEELNRYSEKQLRAIINEIYASHGLIFPSKSLSKYYKRKDWYHPQHANVDNLLNDVERINIRKISRMEHQGRRVKK